MSNLVSIGKSQESKAVIYLKKRKYVILERNYRTPFGEIDIIARDKGYLVFIEVKYRSNKKYGEPEDAIDFRKKIHIVKSALFYLKKNEKIDSPFRFDVLALSPSLVKHYKNAFDAEGIDVF